MGRRRFASREQRKREHRDEKRNSNPRSQWSVVQSGPDSRTTGRCALLVPDGRERTATLTRIDAIKQRSDRGCPKRMADRVDFSQTVDWVVTHQEPPRSADDERDMVWPRSE
jgi:hypothetical protein